MDIQMSGMEMVFSMLSPEEARSARQSLLAKLRRTGTEISDELFWADIDEDGHIVRRASTSLSELTTQLLPKKDSLHQFDILSRMISRREVSAGYLKFHPELDTLLWVVPYTDAREPGAHKPLLRCFSVSQNLFAEIVQKFNPDSDLTRSELKTLYYLMGNIGLKAGAKLDGVAYETKRSHLKSGCLKLGCSGQKEVGLKLLGQLAHLVSVCDADSGHARKLEEFIANFFPKEVSIVYRRFVNDRPIATLEFGAKAGRPVILIHGLMLPLLLESIVPHASRLGLRVIIPVREGYFNSRNLINSDGSTDLTTQAVDDIRKVIQNLVKQPCDVFGHSRGAFIATRLLRQHPEWVRSLHLVSLSLPDELRKKQSVAGQVLTGLVDMARDISVLKAIAWKLKSIWVNEASFRRSLLKIFGESSHDREVLEAVTETGSLYSKLLSVYQSSIVGVSSDLVLDDPQWSGDVARSKVAVSFWQGTQDPLLSADDLDVRLVEAGLTKCNRLPCGHFLIKSHSKTFWESFAEKVADQGLLRPPQGGHFE